MRIFVASLSIIILSFVVVKNYLGGIYNEKNLQKNCKNISHLIGCSIGTYDHNSDVFFG